MSNVESSDDLRFSPFNSLVDPSFWHKLSQIKLDVDRLEEKVRPIWGYYSSSTPPGLTSTLQIDCSAFNNEPGSVAPMFSSHGVLLNKNTIETFKSCDKVQLLEEYGCQLWQDILSGKADDNPSLLSRFILLTYADLKKHHFYYWFAFPAPNFDSPTPLVGGIRKLSDVVSAARIEMLTQSYMAKMAAKTYGYFSCDADDDVAPLARLVGSTSSGGDRYAAVAGFADPCPLADNPGWPLRNLVAWLSCRCPHLVGKVVRIIALRLQLSDSRWTCANSLSFEIVVPSLPVSVLVPTENAAKGVKWVGWERNDRGKFGPRMANLSSSMDPVRLAETSVDLNLKLMKWRLSPELNLDVVKQTRCLLLGAGTLGCSVARNLLAWGVRQITMVDNGRVSYSNPVRQSLYTHAVCASGGELKAVAAARALKDIFPGVDSRGEVMSIPMPGHPIGESLLAETTNSVAKLEELVANHDAVFLLMDSRESRWLPTLMAASKDKIVLNAALGFDTYLVMRHGSRRPPGDVGAELPVVGGALPGDRLGCYFCNDVTAPGNSQRDRSLDQQCTVTRPGVAGIAAALAVELLVSVLQHPLGSAAPADSTSEAAQDCILGLVPHSVRGFLTQFSQVLPSCHRFDKCIACSPQILSEYETNGLEFLLRAFNTPNYLEDITGLTQMKAETENAEIWELSDSDSCDME